MCRRQVYITSGMMFALLYESKDFTVQVLVLRDIILVKIFAGYLRVLLSTPAPLRTSGALSTAIKSAVTPAFYT